MYDGCKVLLIKTTSRKAQNERLKAMTDTKSADFDRMITTITQNLGPLITNFGDRRWDTPVLPGMGFQSDQFGFEMEFANGFGISVIRDSDAFEIAVLKDGQLHYDNPVSRGDVERGLTESMVIETARQISDFNLKGEVNGVVSFEELITDDGPDMAELLADMGPEEEAFIAEALEDMMEAMDMLFVVPARKLVPGDTIMEVLENGTLFKVTNPERH